MSLRICRPFSMPGPRNDLNEVRFALSYDALKISGIPQRDAIFATDSAIIEACSPLSITHGPAMSAMGAPPPMDTAPAEIRSGCPIRRCRPLQGEGCGLPCAGG